MIHVGTHTSIAGGIEKTYEKSAAVGSDTLMIFAKSPRGWKIPSYAEEQYEAAQALRVQYGQVGGMIHSNYIANLSKPAEELTLEVDSIVDDFMHAHRLGYKTINVHIGKLKDRASLDEAMTNMTRNVETILKRVRDAGYDDVQYLFENTAGQGSEIGSNFEELALLASYLKDLPVGYTIDTAHCQGGGIDLDKRDEFIDQFGEKIGIEKLVAIHLNDSKAVLGSRLDRHASLGHGFIGWKRLQKVVKRAVANDRHCYIETPEPERWPDEVAMVRKIAAGDCERIDAFHEQHYATQFLKKYTDHATDARAGRTTGLFG